MTRGAGRAPAAAPNQRGITPLNELRHAQRLPVRAADKDHEHGTEIHGAVVCVKVLSSAGRISEDVLQYIDLAAAQSVLLNGIDVTFPPPICMSFPTISNR